MEKLDELNKPPVKGHGTIVCGWGVDKKLIYMRSFDYEHDPQDKELAIKAMDWCEKHCVGGWMITDVSLLKISQD